MESAQGTHKETPPEKPAFKPGYPKSDPRYWLKKIGKNTWTEGETFGQSKFYSVQMQVKGRRVRFPLNLSGEMAAATRARDIYLSLVSPTGGWDATLARYKPATEKRVEVPTVGDYIAAAKAVSSVRPLTFETYANKFRTLVGHMTAKAGDTSKNDHTGKLDKETGKRLEAGASKWRAEVEAVKLNRITPDSVKKWSVSYVTAKGVTPESRRNATNTVNTLVRNSASLFADKITRHLKHLNLPSPLPFEGVSLPKADKIRYRSKFSVEILYEKAKQELWHSSAPDSASRKEMFVMWTLSLFAGLRRGEIDKLMWAQVDFNQGGVYVEATDQGDVKSNHSASFVRLAPSVLTLLTQKKAVSDELAAATERPRSQFVIESAASAKPPSAGRTYHYRCDNLFAKLNKWLRENGLQGEQKPLHTQRKEFGSYINENHGLSAAADALRHGNVNLTRNSYARPDNRASFGPEHFKSAEGSTG